MLSITPRMTPCTQCHPGSITPGHGDGGDTTYPLCPGWRGPCCPPACSPGVRGQAAAEVGGCSGGGVNLSWRGARCPPGPHAVLTQLSTVSHLPGKVSTLPTCPAGSGPRSPAPGPWFKGWPWEHPGGTSTAQGQGFTATWNQQHGANSSETGLGTG